MSEELPLQLSGGRGTDHQRGMRWRPQLQPHFILNLLMNWGGFNRGHWQERMLRIPEGKPLTSRSPAGGLLASGQRGN